MSIMQPKQTKVKASVSAAPDINAVLSRLQGVKKTGDGWIARCPAHEDKKASLSVNYKGDRIMLKCHATCTFADIVGSSALKGVNLGSLKQVKEEKKAQIIEIYPYTDEDGELLYQCVRFEPKDFRQRQPDGKGGWVWNLKDVRLVLYRLREVLEAARAGKAIFVVEGEKDVENLFALGFVATTSPMGAGKWKDEYSKALTGAHIVIIADKDAPGRKHAQQVAESVFGVAKSVRVLELPGDGKDASDWIKAGGTKEDLQAICKATPIWKPAEKVEGIQSAIDVKEPTETPATDWPEPLPFGATAPPEISAGLLPAPLDAFVEAQAEALQVPRSAVVIAVLCSVAVTMAKKAQVFLNKDWAEPLNLYGAMVLPPGERKSAILAVCMAPLLEWDTRAAQAFKERHGALMAEKRILENRARAAEKRASVKNDPAIKDEAIRLAREAASFHVPATTQTFVDDITTEKIVSVMQEQLGRVALFSDEGGIFDIMAGMYTGTIKIDAYLKAYDGKTIRVDRIGRASEVVTEPALTMCLGVQPSVIYALGQQPAMRGRGLLGRVLYVLPESMLGHRKINPEPVPDEVKTAYHRILLDMMDLPFPEQNEVRRIQLSENAERIFGEFRQKLEGALRPDADLGSITDWAGKLAGGVARIAALWHSVECVAARHLPWKYSVNSQNMQKAVALGKLLQAHAKAAFGMMKADECKESAAKILAWITKKQLSEFTKRDIYRGMHRHFSGADEIEAPLAFLLDRGYARLRRVTAVTELSPRAVTVYEPHPSVLSGQCHRCTTPMDIPSKNEKNIKYQKNGYLWGGGDTRVNEASRADENRGSKLGDPPVTAVTFGLAQETQHLAGSSIPSDLEEEWVNLGDSSDSGDSYGAEGWQL